MTSLKCKFITCIIGCREKLEKQSPSNRKYIDYAVEVIKLVFKVQKQSFANVTFSRTPLVADKKIFFGCCYYTHYAMIMTKK